MGKRRQAGAFNIMAALQNKTGLKKTNNLEKLEAKKVKINKKPARSLEARMAREAKAKLEERRKRLGNAPPVKEPEHKQQNPSGPPPKTINFTRNDVNMKFSVQ